ncbi:hypothetical protein BCV70DRAFT_197201 [Testicularia cyperi]|uniref:Uncharacterized protein n=1 Tax=Testicularia cyperi TaxID=1882483 RepID=A0A317XYH4_9BASI|nr:hypothetical protein BCV70DRAFT_197201 [Testicularia cyperi]
MKLVLKNVLVAVLATCFAVVSTYAGSVHRVTVLYNFQAPLGGPEQISRGLEAAKYKTLKLVGQQKDLPIEVKEYFNSAFEKDVGTLRGLLDTAAQEGRPLDFQPQRWGEYPSQEITKLWDSFADFYHREAASPARLGMPSFAVVAESRL